MNATHALSPFKVHLIAYVDGLPISHTDVITSKAVNKMTTTTKTIRQSHKDKKTKSFVGREAQIRHFRRSTLAKDTIKRILLRTKLARNRYSSSFVDRLWDATKGPFTAAAKRRKVAHRRRRRRNKAFIAVVKEIHKAQQEASRRTHAQSIACFGRAERGCSSVVIASASNSQARHKSSPLPSGSPAFVIPIQRLPSWAHWYEPPLSTSQVEYVRERIKLPAEYLRISPNQRDEVLVDDLSAALESMSQAFNRPCKFIGMFPGDLRPELLRPPVEAMDVNKDLSGPTKERTIGNPRKKHVSTKRNKSNELGRLQAHLSEPCHTSTTNISESNSDGRGNTEEHVVTEKLAVHIPTDTDMATDYRAYSQWPDDSGALKNAHGCLLPARYRFARLPGFEWIRPVRTCQRCYETQQSLGGHFNSMHHSCLLNDNCDGTFTIVGKYTAYGNKGGRPARVKTKKPLPEDAPRPVDARAPATWVTVQQQKSFEEIKTKARLHATRNPSEKTVDEMMLLSKHVAHSPAEASEDLEPSDDSRAPSLKDVKACSSHPEATSGSGFNQAEGSRADDQGRSHISEHDEVEIGAASHMHCDVTQENWRSVEKYLTGGQFSPPKRGHFASLLSSPRSRGIATRPGKRFIADQPKKVRLLMVHMTGEEPPMPCDSCAMGRGPFKKCVAVSKKAAAETTNGRICCTNCASNGNPPRSCNVEDLFSQPRAGQNGSQRKQRKEHPTPGPREQTSLAISSRMTKVDSRFTFTVYVLPLDGSLELDAAPSSVRLCSLTSGKAMVELEGNSPFLIGPHGMIKLMPGMRAQVSNASDGDTVIHVSTVKS